MSFIVFEKEIQLATIKLNKFECAGTRCGILTMIMEVLLVGFC